MTIRSSRTRFLTIAFQTDEPAAADHDSRRACRFEVKPLPADGQPRSFAGAVGNFTHDATSVKPTMVEAGDPVTITAKITGRGDFDRVTAPQMTDPTGWKTYPPSGSSQADDDVGISGVKTFQMAAIPETKKRAVADAGVELL